MSEEIKYGKNTKRIVFTDTDHRHAQLTIRLRYDKISQAAFFRHLISGYLDKDERILSFVDDISANSKIRQTKSKRLRTAGKQALRSLGLSERERDDIFDLLEQEHPDL
jgi:hypothetical protein